MHRDFVGEKVAFYYIYKRLEHPGRNGYVDPFTIQERLLHIQEAKKTLGTRIPWICDTMQDEMRDAFGGAPNSEFILDAEGTIVRMRRWSNPDQLHRDLTELVGEPKRGDSQARRIAVRQNRGPTYATGVTPKLKVPSGLRRLRIETVPQESAEQRPYYAKLQAFGQDTVIDGGDGLLHLYFQLDPIHHVHWNNLAAPIEYEIKFAGDNADSEANAWYNVIVPTSGTGPDVEAEADSDPREFLVHLCGVNPDLPLELNVRYFACSDEAGWCRAVSQSYLVHLQRDDDSRRRMDSRGRAGARGFFGRFGQ